MKELISKILKEHLNVIKEGIHAEIYDKYSFDEFDITNFKGMRFVFLNGTKQLTNDHNKNLECDDQGHCIPIITLVKDGQEFEIPQWDRNGNDILKLSKNKSIYMSFTDFKKYFPQEQGESKGMTMTDVVSKIKSERKFLSVVNIILDRIYSKLKTEDGEPMYGESVKDDKCKTNRGVINFKGIKYGVNNSLISNWSILNYFNTNSKVIGYLLRIYMKENGLTLQNFTNNFSKETKGFLDWLQINQNEYFGPESIHLDELERLNLTTLTSGIEREQMAVRILLKIHNIGEEGITEYCPGSIEDTRYGRDLKINNEDLYYQIKPLNGVMRETEKGYEIPTHSMKKYGNTVDRLMFISQKGNYYIFSNSDYEVSKNGDFITFKNPPILKG
jgi:hypothetical protein